MDIDSFPPGVAQVLQTYVYRLIDPRNGETFYVGKGTGNRVFSHARAEKEALDADDLGNKLKRIRAIRNAGLDVLHVIHRHGIESESTAFEVEAALIDAYPGCANEVSGAGSSERGPMHVNEIIERYAAAPAVFDHRALLISVNKSAYLRDDLYEATRCAWKLSPKKAAQAEVILSTVQGMIRAAFVAEEWMPVTKELFPAVGDAPDRYGFIGRPAPPEIATRYVGKRVPDEYRKRGAANPVKYTW